MQNRGKGEQPLAPTVNSAPHLALTLDFLFHFSQEILVYSEKKYPHKLCRRGERLLALAAVLHSFNSGAIALVGVLGVSPNNCSYQAWVMVGHRPNLQFNIEN